MPQWIHDRARHIQSQNPDMDESTAFAIATQQSHALGKTPKGYGTAEGRRTAKSKYRKPKSMTRTAQPLTTKVAFVESLPTLAGLSVGYGPGRSVAGETAAAIAPKGRVERSENWARNAAVIGAPLGGLVAMGLARKYRLAPRLGAQVAKSFPEGLIAEPEIEKELVHLGVPGVSAITGSLVGGGLTGAAVGGLQRLRGPVQNDRDKVAELKPSPMWSRIGGAASRKPMWAAQSGFTPTGFKTPAQRLSKSMDMGKVDGSAGLKPLDIGKMQQAAENAVKTGSPGPALLAITKVATGQPIPVRREREDAETGDETEPEIDKEGEDLGGQSFSTNQYSGVMNPAALKYQSGIPGWSEPPVKTAGPPSEKTATGKTALDLINEELGRNAYILPDPPPKKLKLRGKTASGITPAGRLNSASAIGAPKATPAPGPSIAQISKPKGFGMPMSGAKKGNNII